MAIGFQNVGTLTGIDGETISLPTSLQFGPDGRLYVTEQNGTINALTVTVENGEYIILDHEVIMLANGLEAVKSIQNHNDDGSLSGQTNRQVTGIVVTGTAENPVLYVSSSDPRIAQNGEQNLDTNSGIVTRISLINGEWEAVDILRGLPRSEENHATNDMILSPDGTKLYVMNGGNTNNGAPSSFFSYTGEYALSGVMLEVDLDAIDLLPVQIDADGGQGGTPRSFVYDFPTLDDPNTPNVTDGIGEDADGMDEDGPFGGRDGLNMAILPADAPVRIYADGFRNPYDIAQSADGNFYTVDNGSNGGLGGDPIVGLDGEATNDPNQGGTGDPEPLFLIEDGGYYGHPSPARSNQNLAWTVYDDDGNPDAAVAVNSVPDLSALVPDSVNIADGFLIDPSKFTGDATRLAESGVRIERTSAQSNTIVNVGSSTNGLTYYSEGAFDGALDGSLIAGSFNGNLVFYKLNSDGTGLEPIIDPGDDEQLGTADDFVLSNSGVYNFDGAAGAALDVTVGPNGTLWVANIFNNEVNVYAPTGEPLPDDTDFDNDGLANTIDPFMRDATNGGSVAVTAGQTLLWDFDTDLDGNLPGPAGFSGGLTGVMIDGTTDFEAFFQEPSTLPEQLIKLDNVKFATAAGGGSTVIENVSNGDPFVDNNSGEYLFHTGVTVGPAIETMTIKWTVFNPAPEITGTFQQIGGYIGTGDQSNYLKVVAIKDSAGGAGIQMSLEDGDVIGGNTVTFPANDIFDPSVIVPDSTILFELVVDLVNETATPTATYETTSGFSTVNGTPLSISNSTVLDVLNGNYTVQGQESGLAVGLFSSNNGEAPADTFQAIFDGIEITATELDLQPDAVDDVAITSVNSPLIIPASDLLANDTDLNPSDVLTITGLDNAVNGTAELSNDGMFITFTPDTDFEGIANFDYTVTDTSGLTDTATVDVSVADQIVLFRVNAGGGEIVVADGPNWEADTTGANSQFLADPGSDNNAAFNVIPGATVISGTPAAIFQTERWDDSGGTEMQWEFDVNPGIYEVRLFMGNGFDGTSGVNQRVFDVAIEGEVLPNLDDLDLSSQFGHLVGAMVTNTVQVIDGTLDIDFLHGFENPLINGIEIVQLGTLDADPIVSIVSGNQSIDEEAGQVQVSLLTSFTVPADEVVEVSFEIVPGSASGLAPQDYTFNSPTAVFDPATGIYTDTLIIGGSSSDATINIDIESDDLQEADEFFTVNLTGVSSNAILGTSSATITIEDDDTDTTPGAVVVAINAGGPTLTQDGIEFSADAFFINGTAFEDGATADLESGNGVQSAFDGTVYETERFGDGSLSYQIPVPVGAYTIELYFAEIFQSDPGTRVFGVTVEGQEVLADFDILGQNGGDINQPITFTVPESVSPDSFGATDAIDIGFSALLDNAKISAIVVRNAEVSGGEAEFSVTASSDNVQISNFGGNSFQITNTGSKDIEKVEIDVTNALYPDAVFDPFGEAGDSTAKLLTIDTTGSTGIIAPDHGSAASPGTTYIGVGGIAGFEGVQLEFDASVDGGFNPGETIGFSVDMDPNSIAGSTKAILDSGADPAPWDIGGISGAELIGSTYTITFTDGTTATGQLSGANNQGGAIGAASQDSPNLVAELTVNNLAAGGVGTYNEGGPTVVIDGPAGTTARIVLTKGIIQPGDNLVTGPYADQLDAQLAALGASDFPANNATEFQTVDIALDGTPIDVSDLFNFDDVPGVTLPGDEGQVPLGFVASIIDPSNGDLPLGPVSDPIYLQYTDVLPADLELSKSASDLSVGVGDTIIFTLTVDNTGAGDATGVVVEDILGAGYSFVSAAGDGVYDNETGLWDIGAIANGTSATIDITVDVLEVLETAGTTPLFRVNSGGAEVAATDGLIAWSADTEEANSPNLTNPGSNTDFPTDGEPILPIDMTMLAGFDVPAEVLGVERFDNTEDTNGEMAYSFDVEAGTPIEIRLYLAELFETIPDADGSGDPTGDRIFSVNVNGAVPATFADIDPYALAGAFAKGVVVTHQMISDGTIDLEFLHQVQNPAIKGIEIVELTGGTLDQSAYVNYAEIVSADQPDPDSTFGDGSDGDDDDATVLVTALNSTDLELSKVASTLSPRVGDTVIFTLTVDHNGGLDASGVTVQDQLPDGFTYVSDAGDGTFDPETGIWTIGELADGTSASIDVTVLVEAPVVEPVQTVLYRVNPGGTTQASADGSAVDWAGDAAPNPATANSAFSAGVTLSGGTKFGNENGAPVFDLTLLDPADPAPEVVFETERFGDQQYDFVVENGDYTVNLYFAEIFGTAVGSRIFDVAIEDQAVLTDYDIFAEAAAGTGAAGQNVAIVESFDVSVDDGNLDIDFTTVFDNAKISAIEIIQNSIQTITPDYSNYAQILTVDQDDPDSAAGDDSDGSDDDATVVLTPITTADLALTKTVSDQTPAFGDTVTFTLTVDHEGGLDATGIQVRDLLADGFTYEGDDSGGNYDPVTGVWTVGNIDEGGSASLEITATVNAPIPPMDEVLFRVNVGGPELAAADASSLVWSQDQGALGSGTASPFRVSGSNNTPTTAAAIDVTDASIPASAPVGVFQAERFDFEADDPMAWEFPVAAGTMVQLNLLFAETFTGLPDADGSGDPTGDRIFDVAIDGVVPAVFDDIDQFTLAGEAFNKGFALTHEFISDGVIDIDFLHTGFENTTVKGIEIIALADDEPTPLDYSNYAQIIAVDQPDPDSVADDDSDGDDDDANVVLSASEAGVNELSISAGDDAGEPGTDSAFTISLEEEADTDTIIAYSVTGTATNGEDYAALTGTVTIPQGLLSASIIIDITDDLEIEDPESVIVTLDGVTSGDANILVGATDAASLNISDNDVPNEVTISPTQDAAEPGTNGAFSVNLTTAAATNTVVTYNVTGTATPSAAGAGGDYVELSGIVTIPAGEISAGIDVLLQNDDEFEGLEDIVVTLTGISEGDANVSIGAVDQASINIDDDEAPEVDGGVFSIAVTPGGSLGASTFGADSFQLTNNSETGVTITSVSIDLSTGILPDMVFDPLGTGGDATASPFTPNAASAALVGLVAPGDPAVDPYSQARNGGFDVLTIDFTDFDPGETFTFTSDVDPNSIQDVPGAGAAGAVSGYELIGSTVTVTFSDGTFQEIATASLYDESFFTATTADDGNVGGAAALVTTADAPAAPSLSVVGETGDLVDTLYGTQVEVGGSSFDLLVEGEPDSTVEILQMDTRLFIASGDSPFDVSSQELPFYANEAMAGKATFIGTIGLDGTLVVPSSLITTTSSDGTPNGGVNAFVALIMNDAGELSQTSEPLVIRQGTPLVYDAPGVMEFDGTNASVLVLPHDPVYEIPSGTVAFSFTAENTSGPKGLFSKDASGFVGGGNHLVIYLDGTTLKARFQDGAESILLEFGGIQAGEEYEIAATFGPDGSGLWVDGNLVASDDLYMNWTANAEAIQWGGRGWSGPTGSLGFDAPFNGTISDKQIYSEVLTASQIAALASTSSGSNSAPNALDDDLVVDEDTSGQIDPLTNDSDPEGDPLEVAGIGNGPANGNAVLNPDGTITYTPDPNFNGADSFEVEVTDGFSVVTSTVSVTVAPINDDPVANDDSLTASLGIATAMDVLDNDDDIDGDLLVIVDKTDGVNGGTVEIAPDGSGVTFTPAAGATAGDTDTFTYTIDDQQGGALQIATVTVNILAEPNIDPVAAVDDVETDEDTPLNFAPGANDFDGNGDPVVASSIFSDPSNGSATVEADGTVTYTPNANFQGEDSFEVTVTDSVGGFDTNVVNVLVNPVNDPPVANPDEATTAESSPVVIDLLANDEDIDEDTLVIQSIEDPANGSVSDNGNGLITYTPDDGFVGEDVFEYTIFDGTETSTASVTVTVSSFPTPIFDEPLEMVFDGSSASVVELPHSSIYEIPQGTISFVFNAGDTIGTQGLFAKDASGNTGGGNHFAAWLGGSTLNIRFQNSGASETLSIPGIVAGADYAFAATFGPDGSNVYLDGSLVETTPLVMNWVTNVEFIQFGGLGWSSASGAPGFNSPFNGTISEKKIFDVALSDEQVAELPGTGSDNTDPVAVNDDLAVDEDSFATIAPGANDIDLDGDTVFAVAIASDPSNGDAVVNPDGTVTYTPDPDYFGSDAFDVTVSDGNGGTAQSTVNVDVQGFDDDPVANDDNAATQQAAPVNVDVLDNDDDADGDALFVTLDLLNGPSNGSALVEADGSITYTPNGDFIGQDSFDYILSDGDGPTSSATVTVDVTEDVPPSVPFYTLAGVTEFDGSASSVENIPHSALFEVPEGTITFSFVDENPNTRQGLFVKDASGFTGGGNHLAIWIDDGDLNARFQDGSSSERFIFQDLVVGQEYEVAAVFGNGVELWVDGTLVDSAPGLTMDWTQNQEFLQIGGLGWSSPTGDGSFVDPLTGQIADVEIYDERLDSDQIQALAAVSSLDTLT